MIQFFIPKTVAIYKNMRLTKYIARVTIFIGLYIYIIFIKIYHITKEKPLVEIATLKLFIFACIMSIVFFILLCSNLINIYRQKTNGNKNSFFIYVKKELGYIVKNYYYDSLDYIHARTISFLKNNYNLNINLHIDNIVEKLSKNVYDNNCFYSQEKNFKSTIFNAYFQLYFIFKILPRLLLACIFFIEWVYYNKLKYFYMFAPLLFLSLFVRYLFYIINQRYNKTADSLDHKFEVIDHEKENTKGLFVISIKEYFNRSVIYFFTNKQNPYYKFNIRYEYLCSHSEEHKKKGDIDIPRSIAKAMPFINFWSKIHLVLWVFDKLENSFGLYFNIMIKFIYFCTWCFLAFTLSYNFLLDSLVILPPLSENPFSGI